MVIMAGELKNGDESKYWQDRGITHRKIKRVFKISAGRRELNKVKEFVYLGGKTKEEGTFDAEVQRKIASACDAVKKPSNTETYKHT